jgi:ATP-dependent Lon protease
MEIIRLSGYLDQEKLAIAKQYLVPRTLKAVGIDAGDVTWDVDALRTICRGWTREAGVRDFERRLARVARKLARQRAELKETKKGPPPLAVRTKDLPSLLGAMQFDPDDTSLEDKVGVATGLAYTTVGGETLEIEVSVVDGRGRLQLTGTLGDVMKESASAAMSYARQRAVQLGIAPDFYKTKDIHIHIPAGATPKDGPSAGIAIATAVVSALTGTPVRGDVAMTGEITLRGRVLPIGGVKEKAVGAHRAGISHVLLPKGNVRDIDDVPQEVRDAITFHSVGSMDEVLALGLRTPSATHAGVTPTSGGPHAVAPASVPARRERGSRRAPVHPH